MDENLMERGYRQLSLINIDEKKGSSFSDPAFAANKTSPVHRWVPWIAGFSRDFVQDALRKHLNMKGGTVLDPFAGVGTTLVEAILSGHNALGFDINPYAALATETKLNAYRVDIDILSEEIIRFKDYLHSAEYYGKQPISEPPAGFSTRSPFYSPAVLGKVLLAQDFILAIADEMIRNLFRIAFASTMVTYSNYSYEPSLGRRASAGRAEIIDYDVAGEIGRKLDQMLQDIIWMKDMIPAPAVGSRVINDTFFNCEDYIEKESVDLIVTSPPYVNNYHYNRNTRPQLYWLGLAHSPQDFKPIEEQNFGTFWQTVREREAIPLEFNLPDSDLEEKLTRLRTLNQEKGIYGGLGWANYAATYFNDCFKFSVAMDYSLKPGATALVVVGPSVLQGVFIPTDKYLGEIAELVGLELVNIHIPRAARIGNSIIRSDVRVGKVDKSTKLYEAVVELKKR